MDGPEHQDEAAARQMLERELDRLTKFCAEKPLGPYTLDGPRDVPEATICRKSQDNGTSCLKLHVKTTQLFQKMQDMGYYCALPSDTHRTELVCEKIV